MTGTPAALLGRRDEGQVLRIGGQGLAGVCALRAS